MFASLRRFIGTTGHIVALATLIVILFAGTAVLLAVLLAGIQGSRVTDGANLYIGIVCGLIVWLFIAVFHVRKEVITLPFSDREAFLEHLRSSLDELDYELKSQAPGSLAFKPSFRSYLPGGRIQVITGDSAATVSGPKISLEILRKRLRIHNHLDNIQRAINEGRRRQGERFLKRVQVNFRIAPRHWHEVLLHVLQPLARDGSLICELNLTAESEVGIPDQTVELQVRPWLQLRQIPAEINKTPLQDSIKLPGSAPVIELPTAVKPTAKNAPAEPPPAELVP